MNKLIKISLFLLFVWVVYIAWFVDAWIKFAKPHYHANFMMYIDWKRVDFSLNKYSEDIWKCKTESQISPKDRVHLHENNQDTIHVHHEWVAWWHFFSNNNYLFSDSYLITDSWLIYKNDNNHKLSFILNWKNIKNPFNKTIQSEDRLLINYWNETEDELIKRFSEVSHNAWDYNKKYDPGTCSGTNENSILFLIKELLHFNN